MLSEFLKILEWFITVKKKQKTMNLPRVQILSFGAGERQFEMRQIGTVLLHNMNSINRTCNSYLRRNWTRRPEFKSWKRMFA